MTRITDAHVDALYDANAVMELATAILNGAEAISPRTAGALGRLLGSAQLNLEPTIDALELIQTKQETAGERDRTPDELDILSEILAIGARFSRLRQRAEREEPS